MQVIADAAASTRSSRRMGIAVLTLSPASAAIAIVGKGKVLTSREFPWAIRRGYSELLDRCLIVSEVAPQLQHLMHLVRPVHGVTVSRVIACGTMPDLRSISMLLIDELDLEVETIDPSEPIDVAIEVPDEPVQHQRTPSSWRPAVVAAAVALLSLWSFLQIAGSSPVTPLFARSPETAIASLPVVPDLAPEATMGRVVINVSPVEPPAPRPTVPAAQAARRATSPTVPLAQQVTALPLPRVDGIMIAPTRRLAIVDGTVVEPGDHVGSREVSSIERDGVVLVEPSGRSVYVAIRTRKPPTGPS